jgi:hypothetical protein
MESGLFLMGNLDDPNHVEMAREIRVCAQAFSRNVGAPTASS